MPNEFDIFDAPIPKETPTQRNPFDIYDVITPERVAKSLETSETDLTKPRVTFPGELAGGIRDITSLSRALSSDPIVNVIRAGGGALRIAGAPLAYPLDVIGRLAQRGFRGGIASLREALGRPPAGPAVQTSTDIAANVVDLLAQLATIPGTAKVMNLPRDILALTRRYRPGYISKIQQLEHLGKVATESEQAAIAARQAAMAPTAEAALLEEQLPGAKEAIRRVGIEAETTPVTTARFPEAPITGPALARKQEAGEFFGGAVARERQRAQSLFEQSYGDVQRRAAGIEYDTGDIVSVSDDILKQAGLARKIQPTRAEELAQRTKTKLLPEGAEKTIEEAETVGRQASMPNSTLEGIIDSLVADSKTASFNDLQVLRSRTRGAIRGFEAKGDFDTARRLKPLEAAYTDTIESGLPESLVGNLRAADELYAKEFIPKFGFESPASRVAESASEDVITNLFPTKGRKESVTTPGLTKSAIGQAEWERLSDTFWQQKILEPAMKEGKIDFAAVKKNLARYSPETLSEATGYKEIKGVIDKFDEAEALTAKQIADWEIKTTGKKAVVSGRFRTLEEAIAGKQKQAAELVSRAKSAEQNILDAQKTLEKLTTEQNGITKQVLKDFAGKARWVGAAGILYPAMRVSLTTPQFITGIGLLFTGEAALKMMTTGLGRQVIVTLQKAHTPAQILRRSAEASAVYRSIVGNEPLEE